MESGTPAAWYDSNRIVASRPAPRRMILPPGWLMDHFVTSYTVKG
jgi:hypothetical protein